MSAVIVLGEPGDEATGHGEGETVTVPHSVATDWTKAVWVGYPADR